MDTCAKCGHTSTGESSFCSSCGASLVEEKPKKTCQNCQSEIDAELVFCDKCGAKYAPPAQPPYSQAAPPDYSPQPGQAPPTGFPQPGAPQPGASQPQYGQYGQAPQSQQPQPYQQYGPASQPANQHNPATSKSFTKNQDMMFWGSIGCGVIGLIIAISTATFGLGEILVFGSLGLGIASKKPAGIIASVAFLVILAIIWFGF